MNDIALCREYCFLFEEYIGLMFFICYHNNISLYRRNRQIMCCFQHIISPWTAWLYIQCNDATGIWKRKSFSSRPASSTNILKAFCFSLEKAQRSLSLTESSFKFSNLIRNEWSAQQYCRQQTHRHPRTPPMQTLKFNYLVPLIQTEWRKYQTFPLFN